MIALNRARSLLPCRLVLTPTLFSSRFSGGFLPLGEKHDSLVRSFVGQIVTAPIDSATCISIRPSSSSPVRRRFVFYFHVLRNVRESRFNAVTWGLAAAKEARADTEIAKGHGSFGFTVGSYDKSCDAARARARIYKVPRDRDSLPLDSTRRVIPGDIPRLTTSIREADLLSRYLRRRRRRRRDTGSQRR